MGSTRTALKEIPTDPQGLLHFLDKAMIDTAVPKVPGVATQRKRSSRTVAPTERAKQALEDHRGATQWSGPNLRRCALPDCKQPAVRKAEHCRHHLTDTEHRIFVNRPQKERRTIKSRPAAARRLVQELVARSRLPVALVMDPTFKAVWAARHDERAVVNKVLYDNMTWTQLCHMLSFELVRGWLHHADTGEVGPWVSAVRKARDMGII